MPVLDTRASTVMNRAKSSDLPFVAGHVAMRPRVVPAVPIAGAGIAHVSTPEKRLRDGVVTAYPGAPEGTVSDLVGGARKDLTDWQWVALQRVLPPRPGAGRRPKWTRRRLLNGIRWRVRVGAPWRDVPERYGHWQSIYQLFRRWQREGVWAWILAVLQAWAHQGAALDWQSRWIPRSAELTSTRLGPVGGPVTTSSRPGRNHPIMGWAGPEEDSPPRCTWPVNRDANP